MLILAAKGRIILGLLLDFYQHILSYHSRDYIAMEQSTMEILVCMKTVPDERGELRLDAESGKMDFSKAEPKENEFDAYALELALRTVESYGGSVSLLTLGDEGDGICVRNGLALGAEEAFLLRDEQAGEKDAAAAAEEISFLLPEIEEKREKYFDLILVGRESTDYSSGLLGGLLAEKLDYPFVSDVTEIKLLEGELRVKKEREDGYQILCFEMPALLSVSKGELEPRYPNVMRRLASRKAELPEFVPKEAKAKLEYLSLEEPEKKTGGLKIDTKDSQKAVEEVLEKLHADKVL